MEPTTNTRYIYDPSTCLKECLVYSIILSLITTKMECLSPIPLRKKTRGSVRCSPHKHENLSSGPQCLLQCTTVTWVLGTGQLWGSLGGPAQFNPWAPDSGTEPLRKITHWPLASTLTGKHICKHRYTHRQLTKNKTSGTEWTVSLVVYE